MQFTIYWDSYLKTTTKNTPVALDFWRGTTPLLHTSYNSLTTTVSSLDTHHHLHLHQKWDHHSGLGLELPCRKMHYFILHHLPIYVLPARTFDVISSRWALWVQPLESPTVSFRNLSVISIIHSSIGAQCDTAYCHIDPGYQSITRLTVLWPFEWRFW